MGFSSRTAARHTIGRCHYERSALIASARVTVHDSRHPIRLTRVALRRSADCPVYQYRSKSSQVARISRPRPRPRRRPRNRKRGNRGRERGRGRFGCGLAALRCVAGCQPATAPVLKRHSLATVHRADWQSAKQQTRLSALRFIGARPGRVQQIRKCANSSAALMRQKRCQKKFVLRPRTNLLT